MALVAPEVQASAGKARLDLVGDVQAAVLVHHLDGFLQHAGSAWQQAVGGEDAVGDEAGEADPVALHVGDRRLDIRRQALTHIHALAGMVGIRCAHGTHVLVHRHVLAHGGGNGGDRGGDAVVGEVGDDDAGATGMELGDAQGQVDRLGAGAGVHHAADATSEGVHQLLGVVEDLLVHVAGMGVEGRQLA
ncbi:hypothetical protein D3C81_1379740 [compost metagenome]